MYQRILVPTDGQTGGGPTFQRGLGLDTGGGKRRAFERALSMAEREGAELHLLLVSEGDSFVEARSADGGMMLREDGSVESSGPGLIRRLTERANEHGVPAVARDCEGDPTYEILQYVHENDIDAVVVDTDESGVDQLACKTLRHGGIDVVTV